MAGELPPSVVTGIGFVGRGSGWVKSLGGFRKAQHTVPDAANATTNAFLAKLCAGELAGEAEKIFQDVRTGLGYKRKEISLSVASPLATLAAKDFSLELAYALDEAEPARYRTTTTLRELRNATLARSEAFDRIFARRFSEIEFALRKTARVESVIDVIENLDAEHGLAVDYPSDCRDCLIRITGVDAQVRCTATTLEIVFPRPGAPGELIDAFAAVRDAFQFDKMLAGLIGD